MHTHKRTRSASAGLALGGAFLIALAACAERIAGGYEEGVAAEVVTYRAKLPGEHVPSVTVETGPHAVRLLVTRTPLCLPQLTALAMREGSTLNVFAYLTANSLALCAFPESGVMVYRLTLDPLPSGRVTIRLSEATGDESPRLLFRSSVTVPH